MDHIMLSYLEESAATCQSPRMHGHMATYRSHGSPVHWKHHAAQSLATGHHTTSLHVGY